MTLRVLKSESQVAGVNIYWVTALIVTAFAFICITGGELIDWNALGYEVLFPFYTSIAIGEWGITRSDPVFEVIQVNARSLFRWVLGRYLYIFAAISAPIVFSLVVLNLTRLNGQIAELIFVYLSTSFFLSSISLLCSLLTSSPHAATAISGIFWIFNLLIKSLLRFAIVPYVYLFIRFAAPENPVWIWNKGILILGGIVIWWIVYHICRTRSFVS